MRRLSDAKFSFSIFGWLALAYGLLEVIYEVYGLSNFIGSDNWMPYWMKHKSLLGKGLSNVAIGLLLLAVHRLVANQEEQNKKSEVAKLRKDLGNWPPSV